MPLSRLYGTLTSLRNRLYDRGLLRSYSLGERTISVGNITTGGTGKTPLVAYVAKGLASRGERVCILTRGYGRKNPGDRVIVSDGENIVSETKIAGDEPVELALKLSGRAIIIADANRVAAAQWARREYGVTAFILDDGFQHRKARRDVDIVCIDATDPFGGGKMLPRGRLREPLGDLSRADVVVITKADLVENIEDLKIEISKLNTRAAIFTAYTQVVRVVKLEEFHADTQRGQKTAEIQARTALADVLRSEDRNDEIRILAFCGLGNPESFFRQVLNETEKYENLDMLIARSFPDHHAYTQTDIEELEKQAKDGKADVFVTTAKDAVKLRSLRFSIPCFVVEVDVVLDRPAEFAALL